MAVEVFANNAQTTLTAPITSNTQTSFNVTSAAGWPVSGQYRVIIDNELILITTGQGTTTWGCGTAANRGIEGTSATTHLLGAQLTQIYTAASLPNMGPSGSFSSIMPAGLPGAVQPSMYAGGTSSGAPVSGTFAVGNWVVDRSGNIWICVVGGTPGSWLDLLSGYFTRGAAPALSAPNIHLSTYALGSGSNDRHGSLNILTSLVGAPLAGSHIVTITFSAAHANTDYSVLWSGDTNANTPGVHLSAYAKTNTGFQTYINGTRDMVDATNYSFDYMVVG